MLFGKLIDMHQKFLSCLCCPETKEPFELVAEVIETNGFVTKGLLRTSSGRQYPIVRGIPRFVGSENYAGSFGFEWNRWPRVQFESDNVGRPMEGHTTKMWELITGNQTRDFKQQTIVEFGCGPGRFLDVVLRKHGIAIGMDMSVAVEAARGNFENNPDVLIVQGDIMKPPFKDGSFDAGYTIGVLHHTPAPSAGFSKLVATVKKGGWVACVVYPREGFYALPSVNRHRRINASIHPYLGYGPALLYSYFSAIVLTFLFNHGKRHGIFNTFVKYLEEQWLPCLYIPDVRWRILDVFDGITPSIASTHSPEEVREWCIRAGCSNYNFTGWGDTSIVGVRD
jgi:SAM-dependent methyltransferase